jgi:hypothetical protein
MVKRWLTGLGITAYLGALLFGVVAHAANFHDGSHPSMYFLVWDMFCGWSAYETRTHVVGQGVSGKFYELAPGPWGDYRPYSNISRQHYDSFNLHQGTLALNCLKHTEHEPMTRLYVVEEVWAKKYNLPESIWKQRYPESKEPYSYFRVLTVMTPEGQVTRSFGSWLAYQTNLTITDNPRLTAEANRSQPMFLVQPQSDSKRSLPDPLAPLGN